jgi:hypothetical protein
MHPPTGTRVSSSAIRGGAAVSRALRTRCSIWPRSAFDRGSATTSSSRANKYLARSAADEPRGIAGVCAVAIAAVDRARAARYALAVNAIRLGVVVWLTDQSMAVTDLARTLEQAGIESLFLTEHTHVPVSRRDVLDDPVHSLDAHLLDSFTALGGRPPSPRGSCWAPASASSRSMIPSSWPSRSRPSITCQPGDLRSVSPPDGSSKRCKTMASSHLSAGPG